MPTDVILYVKSYCYSSVSRMLQSCCLFAVFFSTFLAMTQELFLITIATGKKTPNPNHIPFISNKRQKTPTPTKGIENSALMHRYCIASDALHKQNKLPSGKKLAWSVSHISMLPDLTNLSKQTNQPINPQTIFDIVRSSETLQRSSRFTWYFKEWPRFYIWDFFFFFICTEEAKREKALWKEEVIRTESSRIMW